MLFRLGINELFAVSILNKIESRNMIWSFEST
jgi:hypothetical protein